MSKRGENIYKRKDNRWEARIKKSDGNYTSVYGRTYTEAKEKRIVRLKEEEKREISVQKCRNDSNDSILNQLEEWLEGCYKRVKLSTYESYYYCITTYIYPYLRKTKFNTITKAEMESFVSFIVSRSTLSYSYQNKILTIFRVALRSILQEDNKKKALLDALRLPKKHSKLVEVFTFDEQRRIETILLKNNNIKSLCILLCFYTGLRLGELGALKWSNINIGSNIITITGTLARKKNFGDGNNKTILYVSSPKNNSSNRQIPLPAFLSLKLRCVIKHGDCFVLSNSQTPMDTRSLQKYYMNILKRAGIEYRKFHTIRHTFATRALEMGVDIKTVSELLGHASVTNTLNIYAHSLMEQKKRAIEKLSHIHINYAVNLPSDMSNRTELR